MKNEEGQQVKEILKDDELVEGEATEEIVHLKTKPVPAIVMLLAGLIAAVYTFIQGLGLYRSLITIFFTLLIFLIIGEVIKALLDRIEIVVKHEEEETPETEESDAETEPGDEDEEE